MQEIVVGTGPAPQREDAVALGRTLADALGAELQQLAAEGRHPARELATRAEQTDAGLIVIGSSHRSPLGRVALGSVGTALIHGAPCAVAVAPRGYAGREDQRLLRIAVAYDGGAESVAALETAASICRRTRARLSIFTAADAGARGLSAPMPTGGGPAVIVNEQRAMQGVLRAGLDRVPEGLPVDGRLLLGPAAAEIAGAAADQDLLVIGSHAHGTFGRTVLGSVSTELIHCAECPVMVLPRGVPLSD